MEEKALSHIKIIFGVGNEYPGEKVGDFSANNEEACFVDAVRALYAQCQERADAFEEDVFPIMSVVSSDGESLFELEDRLTEWLDP